MGKVKLARESHLNDVLLDFRGYSEGKFAN